MLFNAWHSPSLFFFTLMNLQVVWMLPTDGNTPKLGIFEQERVISLFRESRKKSKKEKKQLEKVGRLHPGNVVIRAIRSWLWSRRVCAWCAAARAAKETIRYSKKELLRLRYSPAVAAVPLPTASFPFLSEQPRRGDTELRAQLWGPSALPPPGLAPAMLGFTASSSSRNTPQGTSKVEMLCVEDLEASVRSPAATCVSDPGAEPKHLPPPASDLEAEWKKQWKIQYLARLDSLAETAWQNHLRKGQELK